MLLAFEAEEACGWWLRLAAMTRGCTGSAESPVFLGSERSAGVAELRSCESDAFSNWWSVWDLAGLSSGAPEAARFPPEEFPFCRSNELRFDIWFALLSALIKVYSSAIRLTLSCSAKLLLVSKFACVAEEPSFLACAAWPGHSAPFASDRRFGSKLGDARPVLGSSKYIRGWGWGSALRPSSCSCLVRLRTCSFSEPFSSSSESCLWSARSRSDLSRWSSSFESLAERSASWHFLFQCSRSSLGHLSESGWLGSGPPWPYLASCSLLRRSSICTSSIFFSAMASTSRAWAAFASSLLSLGDRRVLQSLLGLNIPLLLGLEAFLRLLRGDGVAVLQPFELGFEVPDFAVGFGSLFEAGLLFPSLLGGCS